MLFEGVLGALSQKVFWYQLVARWFDSLRSMVPIRLRSLLQALKQEAVQQQRKGGRLRQFIVTLITISSEPPRVVYPRHQPFGEFTRDPKRFLEFLSPMHCSNGVLFTFFWHVMNQEICLFGDTKMAIWGCQGGVMGAGTSATSDAWSILMIWFSIVWLWNIPGVFRVKAGYIIRCLMWS